MEEEMELIKNEVVRLCSYYEARNEIVRDDPGIDSEMEDYFDQEVTVSSNNGEFFYIQEDNGEWVYHKDWIIKRVNSNNNVISPKMKRMM